MQLQGVRSLFAREEYLLAVAPAQRPDKDEELYMPVEHAAYLSKPDDIVFKANTKGPLSQHRAAVEAPLGLPKRRRGQRLNHARNRALPSEKSP